MYTTLDFFIRLNFRRFIVGASPELKCRTTNEADTAHVVASYRQLASRDIFFLPTSFKSPHSLRPMRPRDTTYFESYATDFSSLPVFRLVLSKGASKAKRGWHVSMLL